MAAPTTTTSTDGPKEIKMNPPKVFDGSREKFRKFLQDADLYMLINDQVYNNDIRKIGFVLSFMTEGAAAAWADQFLEEAGRTAKANQAPIDLGTYKKFTDELTDAFSAYDTPGQALEQLKTFQMKVGNSINEHVAKFRILLSESRLDNKSPIAIDLFRETLTIPLQR